MAIKLSTAGHYFDASNGSCRAATVTQTFEAASTTPGKMGDVTIVNVAGWNHDGDAFARTSVPVDPKPTAEATANSFHANEDCPFNR